MKQKVYNGLVKLTLKLANFPYTVSTRFATKDGDGLHPEHSVMNYDKFFLHNVNEDDEPLHIGSGNNPLTFDLAKKPKLVVGIDTNEENIQVARNK